MSERLRLDRFDIEISLSGLPEVPIAEAIERFLEAVVEYEKAPVVRNNRLLLVSTDLMVFLGYVRFPDAEALEVKRFEKRIRSALEQNLFNALSKERRAHYRWSLAALGQFSFGRYLEDPSETERPSLTVLRFPDNDEEEED